MKLTGMYRTIRLREQRISFCTPITERSISYTFFLKNKRFNEKSFRQTVKTSRLSFASPDELNQILGVAPGMVSPFNLLNDRYHQVSLIVDQEVLKMNKLIGVHPNTNTQTVILKTADLLALLKKVSTSIQIINF